jgi:hypothetical protein
VCNDPPAGAGFGRHPRMGGKHLMVILGLILLIIGLIAGISILTIIGAILLVVGLILNFVPIGGTRRRYY